MPLPFDIEPRFFDRSTLQRIQFNPDNVLSVDWELVEAGGIGQVNIKLALPFEQCPVSGGDIVEIWALGESAPRLRAAVSIPDPGLDLSETQTIAAYGLMEDMNHVLMDRIAVYPGGKDLNWFAAQVADDYQARRPDFKFVRDLQETDVALETFNCANTTARAAMDQLQKQAGRNAVWGWDVDPVSLLDRLYLRPRIPNIGHQWFVGDRVKAISGASDFSGLTNAMKVQGGSTAKFPQLMTNPSFEVPTVPDAATGDLLTNGGFETGTGGSTSIGGTSDMLAWTISSLGVTRNGFDPSSNHNSSPHSGKWYLLLDTVGDNVWQEVPVTPVTTQYNASLYAAKESGASASAGTYVVEGRVSPGGTVIETYTLPFAPLDTAWNGGQGSTIDSGDGISQSIVFQDPTITTARIRVTATANVSAQHGLLIDDVVFAAAGSVGQQGWSTHVQIPGSLLNQFVTIDWACRAAAWEGLYGVRTQVIADSGHKPAIAPFPGDDSGSQGYHFKPGPQQNIRCGCRVRMSPGLNSADGECQVLYREWAGDGHETQTPHTALTTIPNDTHWHFVAIDVSAHGDAASATVQVEFSVSGTYDVDGFTARDVAAGENGIDPVLANYLRSGAFEHYVRADDPGICIPGSPGALSFSNYGRRESLVSNQDILDWNADAIAWAKAYFDKAAIPINRNRLEILHEPDQVPSPGEGTQVQISGLAQADIIEWPSRAQYTWAKSALALSLELSDERPTIAKLLKQIDNSSSSSGAASSIAAVSTSGSGTITPGTLAVATATTLGGVIVGAGIAVATDGTISVPTFVDDESPTGTINGSNTAFTLANAPLAGSLRVYLGASSTTLQRLTSAAWSVAGTALTMTTAPASGSSLRVEYRY